MCARSMEVKCQSWMTNVIKEEAEWSMRLAMGGLAVTSKHVTQGGVVIRSVGSAVGNYSKNERGESCTS